MLRVVVIGVGLDGLMAQWVFRQHPRLEVWCIGDPAFASSVAIVDQPRHSNSLKNLFKELKVLHASFTPRVGIMLRGSIKRYPDFFEGRDREELRSVETQIANQGFREKRKPTSVLNSRTTRCLRYEQTTLVQKLSAGTKRIISTDDWTLAPGQLHVGSKTLDYDFAVLTEPLWACRNRTWFTIPEVAATDQYRLTLIPREAEQYCPWDIVLTPYTPTETVASVHAEGHQYFATAFGCPNETDLLSDLNFLFPSGYDLVKVERLEKAVPTGKPPKMRWPDNVAPLGELAEWKRGLSLDKVLDASYELLQRWIR